jgi:hypothetical protein
MSKTTHAARERHAAAMRRHDEQRIGDLWYARDGECPVHGEMHVCDSATNGTMTCKCGAIQPPTTINQILQSRITPAHGE